MTTGEDDKRAIKAMAYQLASREVLSLDYEEMARRAGAGYAPASGEKEPEHLELPFLGQIHRVILDPKGARVVDEKGQEVPQWAQVVILHYLARAQERPPSGETVAFREIKDGHLYYPVFQGRVLRRLEAVFGQEPHMLVDAARPLGGEPASHGDASVTLTPLPRLEITFVVWAKDDEFPARAQVVLDKTVEDHLPAEDIVVLCQQISGMLARNATGGSTKG